MLSVKQLEDGWEQWDGGYCPVLEGTLVDVIHRSGKTHLNVPAGEEDGYAEDWSSTNVSGDIVAWRFSKAETISGALSEADPLGKDPHEPGAKLDAGKTKAGVLHDFSSALFQIAQVGTYGAEKYTRGGWQSVPNAEERYFDAFWRHLLQSRHEEFDKDTGLTHFAHAAWNLLAVIEVHARERKT